MRSARNGSAPAVVVADGPAELGHLRGDRLLVDEHFGDVVSG